MKTFPSFSSIPRSPISGKTPLRATRDEAKDFLGRYGYDGKYGLPSTVDQR